MPVDAIAERAQPVRGADEGIKAWGERSEPQVRFSNISFVKFNLVNPEELDKLVARRDGLMMLLLP